MMSEEITADLDPERGNTADNQMDVDDVKKEQATETTTTMSGALITKVTDLIDYNGDSLETKLDDLIEVHGVVLISKTHCPFCHDVKDLLAERIGVQVHVVEVNEHPDGSVIQKAVRDKTGHRTVPVVFIKGNYVGGCDDVKAMQARGELEDALADLIVHKQVIDGDRLETARLAPVERGRAVNAPFWFPAAVNNWVVRLTGVQVCGLCVLSIIWRNEVWGRYLAVGLLVDFTSRLLAGASLSPLGMISTVLASPFTPDFKPGPPKQFAASCGLMFSLISTCFYFIDFNWHIEAGAVVMGMLAGAAGLEGFGNFCLGCMFYGWGIQFGLIPNHVYRIFTSTKQELVDSWNYMNLPSGAPRPEKVDTDPENPIALKYKKKTDEWTKDDFHLIRNMQVTYFGMPLAIAGLATAFKISSNWTDVFSAGEDSGLEIVVPDAWFQTFAVIAAVIYVLMLVLYFARLVLHFHKCSTEWDCPLRSPSFGAMTITLMLFAFLMYDQIDYNFAYVEIPITYEEEWPQKFARVIFWIGAVTHTVLTFSKFAEWIGKRLEMEHVHPTWMILPVGLAVAALCAPVIPMFAMEEANRDNHADANVYMARFFFSFAYLMWVTLFVITFFKVVTTHNSDNRVRHGVFVWLAAPCVIGLADYAICWSSGRLDPTAFPSSQCLANFSQYYFIGLMFFLGFLWAAFPYIGFFGRDKFGMGYWNECFALDTLAGCAALFYALTGFNASKVLMVIALAVAAVANMCAFLHTIAALIRRRAVFTPEVKWGPLSFMKLTHEAFRGALPKLRSNLAAIDLNDPSGQYLKLFAANYATFCILHEEHARHEDEVIFKTFNDYFAEHCKRYNDDHEEDRIKMEEWRVLCNALLDTNGTSLRERMGILTRLQKELPDFFDHFEEHLRGEEDNLNPIGRKYVPLDLQKQISRESFRITPAKKWEVMIPFIVNNLPRHLQRVRYVKCLCWSMPERAQQIGAIVYRNVDAVMWERLRVEVPEIIPRGASNWRRYY